MRLHRALDHVLQIKIESSPDCTAKHRISCDDCVHKVRRAPYRCDLRNFWWLREELLLTARHDAELRESAERTMIFAFRLFRMQPWVESGRRLRQAGQKYRFAQGEVSGGFPEVSARCCFGADPAVAVTTAIQIFSEDAFLVPAPLYFPGDDRFVKLTAPAPSLATSGQFHQLLGNSRSPGKHVARPQIARTGCGSSAPIDCAMFEKAPVFQHNSDARQPCSHFFKRERELCARLGRRDLGQFPAATIE